jgi:hypothetical protein
MSDVVSFKYKEKEENMELVKNSGPSGSNPNWLMDLEIGTIFLAQDKTSADFVLLQGCLIEKTPKNYCRLAIPELPAPRFVNSSRFCQKYMWVETLGVVKDEGQQPEGKDIPVMDNVIPINLEKEKE